MFNKAQYSFLYAALIAPAISLVELWLFMPSNLLYISTLWSGVIISTLYIDSKIERFNFLKQPFTNQAEKLISVFLLPSNFSFYDCIHIFQYYLWK